MIIASGNLGRATEKIKDAKNPPVHTDTIIRYMTAGAIFHELVPMTAGAGPCASPMGRLI